MSDRTFTVVDARGTDGCATKFSVKGHGGYYHGTHARAALKAFNILCNVKKIKGQCAMIITVREMTQGSDKKELTYKCRREKLKEPLVLPGRPPIEYKNTAHAHKGPMPPCKAGLGKTPGPMKAKKGKKGTMTTGTMKTGMYMSKAKKTKKVKAPSGFLNKIKKMI